MATIFFQNSDLRDELVEEIDFGQALRIIKGFMGTHDTLDALKGFEKRYQKLQNEAWFADEDDELQREYRYEIFSYNLLVEGFSQLFAPRTES